jgi:hypothetical protein
MIPAAFFLILTRPHTHTHLLKPIRVAGVGVGVRVRVGIAIIAAVLLLPAVVQAQAPPRKDSVTVDDKTDTVIKGALRWLVSQLPNEGEFGKNVSLGMQYLLDSTAPDGIMGNRSDGQYMYGHGVASIALAELYGQTRSPTMRPKLEKIIRVILASQNPEGGWRYRPIARDADISVTVLQVVALRAAKNGGLEVPQSTIDRAVQYVKRCYHPPSGGFTYQPNRDPGFARTAAAIYSLQVCGLYDDDMVKKGSEYLMKNNKNHDEWFTYGNFYAAPAQYMIGGDTWKAWYAQIKDTLLKSVTTKGELSYWDGKLDRGRSVGPVYCTGVYTMILAMPYHYIPLYQR